MPATACDKLVWVRRFHDALHIHCMGQAWNDAKQDSEWCQSQPYRGLFWVAAGWNPNPKSGTYLTLSSKPMSVAMSTLALLNTCNQPCTTPHYEPGAKNQACAIAVPNAVDSMSLGAETKHPGTHGDERARMCPCRIPIARALARLALLKDLHLGRRPPARPAPTPLDPTGRHPCRSCPAAVLSG